MTNGEKYRDAGERAEAFWREYRGLNTPYEAVLAFSEWIDSDAPVEAEPLPCPFCGTECAVATSNPSGESVVYCKDTRCGYCSSVYKTKEEAIAEHNRVARNIYQPHRMASMNAENAEATDAPLRPEGKR